MGYQGITTPLDASANNPNAQLQVNGLGTTLQNNSIPVDSLAQSPTTPPTLPPAPAINPNYSLQTSTGNSLIQNNSGALNPPALTTDVSGNGTSPDLYASLMKSIQPDSGASTYNADETNSNISGLQTNANSANQSVIDATNKLNTLNAQLTGINNDTTSKNLSLQNEGGAITTGGVTNASNQNIRDAAIQALPLQVQIMGAQANVATAQGNASLAQNILQQAQDHVDKIFSIQQTDAQNEYSYNKSIVDTYYQYATTEQQAKLDDLKTQQAQDFQTQTNNLNEAQTLANTAITNGSADIAGKILALDPKSSTFTVDLGKLSAQIQQKASSSTTTYSAPYDLNGQTVQLGSNGEVKIIGSSSANSAQNTQEVTGAIDSLINAGYSSSNDVTYIDGNGYFTKQGAQTLIQMAGEHGINKSDFLKQYGQYFDPGGYANYGLTAQDIATLGNLKKQ